MDTSETYIKMCDCPEIQGKKAYKALFAGTDHINIDQLGNYWAQKDVDSTNWRVIWLPRQDQLQEMYAEYVASELEHSQYGRAELMQAFIDFSVWLGQQYQKEDFVCLPTNIFNSGEQLWLAFVMKELHSKTWDGEKWIL